MDRVIQEFPCPTCGAVAAMITVDDSGIQLYMRQATGLIVAESSGVVVLDTWCLVCHGPGFECRGQNNLL